jgi:hypothetical protein
MVLSMSIADWYHQYIVAIGIVAAIVLVLFIFIRVGIVERRHKSPEIRGRALSGRARILSVEHTGGGGESVYHLLRIGLGVEVPGHQPYVVTVNRKVHVIHLARVQTGATVPVEVDATDPQIVRIGFDQPIA